MPKQKVSVKIDAATLKKIRAAKVHHRETINDVLDRFFSSDSANKSNIIFDNAR